MVSAKTRTFVPKTKRRKTMALGDNVLISPDLTKQKEWVKGQVIEVENNSFIGTVISAKTANGTIYFGRAEDFKGIA